MRLTGFSLGDDTDSAGGKIKLTVFYRALQEMDQRYGAFAHPPGAEHLVFGGTLFWAQDDSEPCCFFDAMSFWGADKSWLIGLT